MHGERCSVKSMTGFARISGRHADAEFEVEIKSVNHRFLEVAWRGSRSLAAVERELRGVLQREHRRGRFDVFVHQRPFLKDGLARSPQDDRASQFDGLVAEYAGACRRFGIGLDGLSHFIGELVLRDMGAPSAVGEASAAEVAAILEIIGRCSESLRKAREDEGAALAADVGQRISLIESMRESIERCVSGAPGKLRERMSDRLLALAPDVSIDPERLAAEVALMADRVDVSEELSRLAIHLGQFSKLLGQGHPDGIGRKLDFTLQEIGRELNTIGSKAQDATVQGIVVEAKAELERVREQVQNIE